MGRSGRDGIGSERNAKAPETISADRGGLPTSSPKSQALSVAPPPFFLISSESLLWVMPENLSTIIFFKKCYGISVDFLLLS